LPSNRVAFIREAYRQHLKSLQTKELDRLVHSQPVARVVIGCEQMARLEENVHAALNFTLISETGKQKLQEKVAPSRSAWENFLRTNEDSVTV
jgi:hypothetical protein